MRIVIAGGSGQVGSMLAREYHARGYEVVVLGRNPEPSPWKTVRWDARTIGPWAGEIDGADALVNLAGRSVNCRYNDRNRSDILDSRVESARVVGEAVARSTNPPRIWLQASTATIYAHRFDAPNDESTGILGGDESGAPSSWRFSIDVAKAWETACEQSPTPQTRKLILRSAMMMSPDRGGVFDALFNLVRRGLGGAAGDGRQYVSWIHGRDFIAAIDWLIDRSDVSGIVNLAAPNPLPNGAFMAGLRRAAGIAFGLSMPAWLVELGAYAMGTESELILKSRRVVPGRLLRGGFRFVFPEWPAAAADLCERRRRAEWSYVSGRREGS